MRIAIASIAELPPEFRDDQRLALALQRRGVGVGTHAWDDEAVDWPAYDLVVIRSTWDYTSRRDEFVAWSATVGERLENAPGVIRWNSDKGYLADLEAAGLPVVETRYLGPGDPLPAIEEEIVIKPTVSGGARDTGRFGPDSAPTAIELVERIHAAGRTAMVQPFLDSVDSSGETALAPRGPSSSSPTRCWRRSGGGSAPRRSTRGSTCWPVPTGPPSCSSSRRSSPTCISTRPRRRRPLRGRDHRPGRIAG